MTVTCDCERLVSFVVRISVFLGITGLTSFFCQAHFALIIAELALNIVDKTLLGFLVMVRVHHCVYCLQVIFLAPFSVQFTLIIA